MADTDDNAQRIKRLAQRAKELDEVIVKAAKMQKRIVEEIQRLDLRDRPRKQRMSVTTTAKTRKKTSPKN